MYILDTDWRKIDVNLKQFCGQSWVERWPNFHPHELNSRDGFSIKIYVPALDALQRVRLAYGKPMYLTSAYRTPAHNAREGGAPHSMHPEGKAFDIALAERSDGPRLERLALAEGFTGIGRYGARKFIHMDMRPGRKAFWGHW